ncbi:hypothetical protein LSTR_LSTR002336 [Laodelphax striatellus]|uniref:Glutaredoxin-like protein n=1 Tax=Laodelphax striatellus TaxID=195883 RepID=A0A482X2H8_LAOST|nr:hypothetical protein LSTR_LSTR002336 [Laodelphax striatellus]
MEEKPKGLPRLKLYTKDPCPLCDELKEQLAPYQDRLQIVPVDITAPENSQYRKLYRYEIPVVFLEDRFVCKHRLDVSALERRLSQLEALQ